ncbi:MAG: hypothetical protein H6728_07850 [Myxococcales bacterium]|nr:hypothetical protein [Myxococcales bacterium]MCB9642974.1 hypothetical protein [Myxococcales bacterium]
MVQEQKEAASQTSRSWPEVESSVFQEQVASSSFWRGWVLGGAWGIWGLALAVFECLQGWGVSLAWLDRMPDAQQTLFFQSAWALWSIGVGALLLHRFLSMRAPRSLAETLQAPGVMVRFQHKGKEFPTQAAICGAVEQVFSPPVQQKGGWLWSERGRLASIGELWLLGGLMVAILGAWIQPFLPGYPLWGRAILLAAPWVAMGAFLMIEQPAQSVAVWREGSILLMKIVSPRDLALAATQVQAFSEALKKSDESEEGFAFLSKMLQAPKASNIASSILFAGPLVGLILTLDILRRDGAFQSADALVRSLSTPIALGWWGFGFASLLGVLWAAKRESSPLLVIAAWVGGAVGLSMAWLTRLPGKSVQKVMLGHEVLGLLLFGLGLGLLLAATLLMLRAGLLSESPEQSDASTAYQSMLVAVVLLGAAFLASVFWGWKADLLQRMQRLFAVFALIGVFWVPYRFQKTEGKEATQATPDRGMMLWSGFVACAVIAWMFLWMLWVA